MAKPIVVEHSDSWGRPWEIVYEENSNTWVATQKEELIQTKSGSLSGAKANIESKIKATKKADAPKFVQIKGFRRERFYGQSHSPDGIYTFIVTSRPSESKLRIKHSNGGEVKEWSTEGLYADTPHNRNVIEQIQALESEIATHKAKLETVQSVIVSSIGEYPISVGGGN